MLYINLIKNLENIEFIDDYAHPFIISNIMY